MASPCHLTSHSQSWRKHTSLALGRPPEHLLRCRASTVIGLLRATPLWQDLRLAAGGAAEMSQETPVPLCHLQGAQGWYCRWKVLASGSLFFRVSSTGGTWWEQVCWQCRLCLVPFLGLLIGERALAWEGRDLGSSDVR